MSAAVWPPSPPKVWLGPITGISPHQLRFVTGASQSSTGAAGIHTASPARSFGRSREYTTSASVDVSVLLHRTPMLSKSRRRAYSARLDQRDSTWIAYRMNVTIIRGLGHCVTGASG